MVAQIIDGRALADAVNRETTQQAAAFAQRHGHAPGLAVILIGQHAPSEIYVRTKSKAAEKVGIEAVIHRFDADVDQAALTDLLDELNADAKVQGILLQLPVPDHLSVQTLLNRIAPDKDVDGLNVLNVGKRGMGLPCHLPCTPKGALHLIKSVRSDLTGLHALVIGRSDLVGKPMAQLLLAENCTVTQAHRYSADLAQLCSRADIVVVAAGQAGLVKGPWLKPGAIVIDVGINRLDNGTLRGDVEFETAQQTAGYITPVPGGVGPMTVAMLLQNCLEQI
jgi:methylenetetrahydrofolate dehydrogenase (NADP+)/methenyltetrahydrofolate cyclohydrolase